MHSCECVYVCVYWLLFVLGREDGTLFSLLLQRGFDKVIMKVISPPPCLLPFLLCGSSLQSACMKMHIVSHPFMLLNTTKK